MKNFLKFITLTCLIMLLPSTSDAASPVILFSDITSGPKTGLGDGLGQGSIVTIWGTGFGSSQGTSQVYFKDSSNNSYTASYVYYWTNADGQSGGGPADLYDYHKMQEIAFSIPSSVADGAGKIYVVISGTKSNELDFSIRPGDIFHVKAGGSDTGNGTWSNPWGTFDYVGQGAGGSVNAGDIIYFGDGFQGISNIYACIIRNIDGTANSPISVIAYPGADVLCQGGGIGITHWNVTDKADYWNIAKFKVKTDGGGISTFKGSRIVSNEITNITCASGSSGAISGGNLNSQTDTVGGTKALGNYIHDFGCDASWNWHHTFYITNRGGYPVESYELGWNYINNSKVRGGLHIFDEGVCGDFTGTMKIHDNVVVDQAGYGFGIRSGGGGSCFTMDVEVYNNLFKNNGLTTSNVSDNYVILVDGYDNRANIKFYNNTIYGYGDPSDNGYPLHIPGGSSWNAFPGTWEWKNNIIVDTRNLPFDISSSYTWNIPVVASNNIWYNGGDGYPASLPSWDVNPITLDPLFGNPENKDFRLKPGSPAIDSGLNTSSILLTDILGVVRLPQGTAYDIGAFEYDSGALIDWIAPAAPTNLLVFVQ